MSSDIAFSLDTKGGEDILQNMAAPIVKQIADAIASRATSMASSMTKDPPSITVETKVGTIKRGVRAIAIVKATGNNKYSNYVGRQAIIKSKDAGRV